MKLDKILKQSPLSLFKEQCEQNKFPSYRYRPLNDVEISVLESNNNVCQDWTLVQVQSSFKPEMVRNTEFYGKILLPEFYGTLRTAGGITLSTGISDCTISNCVVENSCIRNVALMANTLVLQGAVVQNVGSIVCSGSTSYGLGRDIVIGTETGGRSIRCLPEMNENHIKSLLFNRDDLDMLESYSSQLDNFVNHITNSWTVIGHGSSICNSNIVRNSWIGAHTRIDGASKIRSSYINSRLEDPVQIFDGVIVEHSMLQAGVKLHSFCQVQNSLMMQGSGAGRKSLITNSIMGSKTKVEEAEVTSSYVGELTQIHHHSLLISALWAEGKGNIGYGANVGSNHTGRLPDQEIIPGEAMFFGLGCSIKFPANYSESPFSIVATGVTTLPQRIKFPFTLINAPATQNPMVPRQFNELLPGWAYGCNSYALVRNQYKYAQRKRSKKPFSEFGIIRDDIAQLVFAAWKILKSVENVKEIYIEKDIPGLGKNYLTEPNRQDAMVFYEKYLKRFFVSRMLQTLEKNPKIVQKDNFEISKLYTGEGFKIFCQEGKLPVKVSDLIRFHRSLEKAWMESCFESQKKDEVRGNKVFDDYDLVHPEEVAVNEFIHQNFQQARNRCNDLLKLIRNL